MADRWRLIETGLRSAAQNIALDRALLEARRAEETPSTLRFLRFAPCALIGCDRSAEQELDLEACKAGGLEIQRRLTGGDALILDPEQLVWELYLHRRDLGSADLRSISRRLCHAAAAAVSAFDVEARYRAPGEVEIDGRRIMESAGVFDGDALLFQGALLVEFDAQAKLRASRLYGAALDTARDRVVDLATLTCSKPDLARVKRYLTEAFESEFGIEFAEGDVTLSEDKRYRAALKQIDHPDWVHLVSRPAGALPVLHASRPIAGGRLYAAVAYDRYARTVRQAWFRSDVPTARGRALADFESALRHVPMTRLALRIERFFGERGADLAPLAPADLTGIVQVAVGQLLPAGINERNET